MKKTRLTITHIAGRVIAILRAMDPSTQAELADEVGVAKDTLASVESGRQAPSLELVWAVEKAFMDVVHIEHHGIVMHLTGTCVDRLTALGHEVAVRRRGPTVEVRASVVDDVVTSVVEEYLA